MATVNLGKVKLKWRGTYAGGTAYTPDDVVEYTDGSVTSSYICVTASTGNAPSSGGSAHSSWNYMAKGQASSPTTTQGDIIVRGASADTRLAIGAAGKALIVNASANGLEYGGAGITEADTWFLTSTFNGDVDPISSNLSRYTNYGANYLGTGMSLSSGTWTFPSTGYWRITVKFRAQRQSGYQSKWQRIHIKSTTNNSSYNKIATADYSLFDNYSATGRQVSGSASIIFDCTNTSTHKIRFATEQQDNAGNQNEFIGHSSEALTSFEFIKLADT